MKRAIKELKDSLLDMFNLVEDAFSHLRRIIVSLTKKKAGQLAIVFC